VPGIPSNERDLGSTIVERTVSVQVAKRAIREECAVKWKNSQIRTDSWGWFGANWLAIACGIDRASMATITVKNGQASQIRLFEV